MAKEHAGFGAFRMQANAGGSSPFSRRQVLIGAGGVATAAVLAACSGGNPSSSPSGSASSGGAPKRGGNFRLGVAGGGSKDVIDGQVAPALPDAARLFTAFETLLTRDDDMQLQSDGLAESVEADSATQYTIRLRKGIEWHNGKTLSADDVIYSLQRVGDEANGLAGFGKTASMDLANLQKLDEYTVRLPMKRPDSTVPNALAYFEFNIVPEGYKPYAGDPSTQAGTGAYLLKSFTPGQESVHERNPNYWRGDGSPWFDTVTITNFADVTAQVNALLGGQIDAMPEVPVSQVETVKARGQNVLVSPGGFWTPITMNIEAPPFNDPRVRQAFRLIVDRQTMLDQVVSGYGDLGNDLTSPFDPGYLDAPQREQNIEEAKSLLKAAGQEGLTVDLFTTDGTANMVPTATVFAEQAKAAGVTVNVKNLPGDAYWGEDFLNYPLAMDFWSVKDYLGQVQQSLLPSSAYNETHWPPKSGEGSDYEALYEQALAAVDEAERTPIIQKMQQYEYDLGGYIIPFFPSRFDGYATNVKGLAPSKLTWGLNNFGHGYRSMWFA